MGRNNKDFYLERMGQALGFDKQPSSSNVRIVKKEPNRLGADPHMDDVRNAHFSGKVTTEEANDLTNSDSFSIKDHPLNTKSSKPSDFSLDHEAYYAHKRAGLN
jgi:hypothetical protein